MSTVPSSPSQATQRQAFQPDEAETKADAPAEPQKQEKHQTDYVVLRGVGGGFAVITTTAAASAKAAIQKVVDAAADKDKTGTFVAVPERSWQPVTVKVETQTVVKFD